MAEMIATRIAYGEGLKVLAETNKNVVVLDADLSKSTKTASFKDVCPKRFFNVGIAEQNLIGVSAGLAASGKIPFASSFAMFAAGRAYEIIRNSVAYPRLNVKIAATHAGLTVGEDGASHQMVEDLSLMRTIPGMVVLNPADAVEAKAAVLAAAEYQGPVYMRFGRMNVPVLFDESYKFEIGKGVLLAEGTDVTFVATGIMVAMALEAREILAKDGISARVVNIHTIKPLDNNIIVESAEKTGAIVTAEEHSIFGGLGSAVSEVIVSEKPVPVELIGVRDTFGESGTPNDLLQKYGLTAEKMVEAAKKAISKK